MKSFVVPTTTCALFMMMIIITISSLAAADTSSDFDDPSSSAGFGGGGPSNSKFCPPFNGCQKGEEPVPKWPLKLTSMGCSGMGGMMMMPGAASGDDSSDDGTTLCCDLRHACLQTCGSIKKVCDDEFTKCIDSSCNSLTSGTKAKEKCEKSVSIYKMMVSMDFSSCEKFDAEQYYHCECVASGEKAASKRQYILERFYKIYNRNSLHKIPDIVSKINGPQKMAAVLQKLYTKFPQVIKRMKDPQQEEMERMMKTSKTKEEDEDL